MASTTGKVIKCKAVVIKKYTVPVSIETIEVDPPQAKEVRIKLVAAGVCHTDHVMQGGFDVHQKLPFVMGHEGAGIVESVGKGVDSVKPGDKVLTVFMSECGKCKFCLGNRTNMCKDTWGTKADMLNRHEGYDGKPRFRLNGEPLYHFAGCSSFSEYTVIPETSCVKVNPKTPLDKACLLACGFATGYGSSANAVEILPGDKVAVWGLGGVGLATVVGAKDKDATQIIGIDTNNDKEHIAKKLGVTDFINPKDLTGPMEEVIKTMTDGGLDFAFVCVPVASLLEPALNSLKVGGTLFIVAFGFNETFRVTPEHILCNRTITGSFYGNYRSRRDIPKLAERYLEGKLPLDDFITHTFKLEQIEEALQTLLTGKSLRSVIIF